MAMVIGTNVASITAQRHLASSQNELATSMERLASGSRINSAMDDAAGLAISHRLDSKITSLNQGVRNANDGISMLQTAEGALEQSTELLTRMKELATQASSGTLKSTDRTALNNEFQKLATELTRIAEKTDFNGNDVLNSSSTVDFIVGDTSGDKISITLEKMRSSDLALTGADTLKETGDVKVTTENGASAKQVETHTMDAKLIANNHFEIEVNGTVYTQAHNGSGTDALTLLADKITKDQGSITATVDTAFKVLTLTSTVNNTPFTTSSLKRFETGTGSAAITDVTKATSAMSKLDTALQTVDSYRSKLGAVSNQLDHTVSNLMNRIENHSAAKSRIQDTDFAAESANLAKAQVLQQAGTAMLAQANASTQSVLSLLK